MRLQGHEVVLKSPSVYRNLDSACHSGAKFDSLNRLAIYSPLEPFLGPFFTKEWRPSEIKLVRWSPPMIDVRLAAGHHLPAIYPYRYFAAEGGLLSYGPDQMDQWRGAAGYVDRILKMLWGGSGEHISIAALTNPMGGAARWLLPQVDESVHASR
jgi:hypothetical protein